MRFILRWFVRFFGLFVFLHGGWMLYSRWHAVHAPDLHRLISDASVSNLRDAFYFAEHFVLQSSFLLALSGFIIILLSFRR